MRSSAKRFVLTLLVAGLAGGFLAAPSGTAAAPAPVAAPAFSSQEVAGLSQEVTYSYVVDPVDVVTRVTATATLTHTRPDDANGSWYFDEYALPIPIEATNLWATVDSAAQAVTTDVPPGFQGMQRAAVVLDPRLLHGQTRQVVFGYELGPQRDREDVWSQANEASYMFPAWTFGDPGNASVEVRIPDTYEVNVMRGELDRVELDGEILLTAEGVDDPRGFSPLVLAIDDSRATTQTAETSIGTVELVAWPDHDEWIDFVVGHVDEGVPVLIDLFGQPWPHEDQNLTIVETLAVVAEGFGGWYDSVEHTITIGDQLHPHLVLHELTHAWINFDVFTERWLVEGFAEEYAFRAVDALGLEGESRPTEADVSIRSVPLSQWTTPTVRDEASQETEDYGYSASAYVIGEISEELGLDSMRSIIEASMEHQITYTGDPEPEPMGQPLGWRQALDLFENHGSTEAAGLFESYVLPPQAGELTARADAREGYQVLAERGGDWTPPLEVRAAMAGWDFDAATAAMDDAAGILEVRDEIDDVLAGTDISLGLEGDYESAPDVGSLRPQAEETLSSVEVYSDVAARDPADGALAAIGAWGTTSSESRLASAREALASGDPAGALRHSEAAAAAMENATRDGVLRLGFLAALVVAGLLLFQRLRLPQEEEHDASPFRAAAHVGAGAGRSGDVVAAQRRSRSGQAELPAPVSGRAASERQGQSRARSNDP